MKSFVFDRIKRCLITAFACIFVGAGIAGYYATNLGSDPVSLWCDGLHRVFNISYGMASFLNTSFFVIILLLFYRRHISAGTFVVWFTLSIWIDVFTALFNMMIPVKNRDVWAKVLFIIIGVAAMAIGLGLQHAARAGCSGPESMVLSICDWIHKPYKYVRMTWDAFFALLGWILGGVIGLGTVIGILLTGPTVDFMTKVAVKYLLPVVHLTEEPLTLSQFRELESAGTASVKKEESCNL